jgi:hypothetical protein
MAPSPGGFVRTRRDVTKALSLSPPAAILPYRPALLRTPPRHHKRPQRIEGIGLPADSVGSPRPMAPSLTFRPPPPRATTTTPPRREENNRARATRHVTPRPASQPASQFAAGAGASLARYTPRAGSTRGPRVSALRDHLLAS